jgi:DNA transformation protein
MTNIEELTSSILDSLFEIGTHRNKKMVGGIGFFKEGVKFAIRVKKVFRLKVDESNEADFEAHGMNPYESNTKEKGMPYWEVPASILENKTVLTN